jgi:hypothetical protein
MDCPNCRTYNPEERTLCWRCDQPLPRPVVKKKRQVTSQQWLYIIVAIMLVVMLANMCGVPQMLPSSPDAGPTGSIAPAPALRLGS